MAANRCARCDLNWPNTATYVKCPRCGVSTSYMWQRTPMSDIDAKHLAFECWLEHETPERRREREKRFLAEMGELAMTVPDTVPDDLAAPRTPTLHQDSP